MWPGKEDPHVRSPAGLRDLERRRNPIGAGGFHVREGVQHCRFLVEIRRHPAAAVVIGERAQADVDVSAEVLVDDLRRQR